MEALYAELNERVEAATNSYYVTVDFLRYIYSEHPIKVFIYHQNIHSRRLVHEFSFIDIF